MDRDEIRHVVIEELRQIGLYYSDDKSLARTRLNFQTLDEITQARIDGQGAFRRGLTEVLSKGAANLIWFLVMAAGAYFAPTVIKLLEKVIQ